MAEAIYSYTLSSGAGEGITITAVTPQIWRVCCHHGSPPARLSFAVVPPSELPSPVTIQTSTTSTGGIHVSSSSTHSCAVEIKKTKPGVQLQFVRGFPHASYVTIDHVQALQENDKADRSIQLHLAKGLLGPYGMGEKAEFLKKPVARTYEFWNTDAVDYRLGTDPLYQSYPLGLFYNAVKKMFFAIFVDHPGRQIWRVDSQTATAASDVSSQHNSSLSLTITVRHCIDHALEYYLIAGNDPKSLHANIALLTGRLPLPPLWALGYQQCRWSYPTAEKVREIAIGFRTRDIPADVIYLDIDYMDEFRCFTFDATAFPDPRGLMKWLNERHFRVVVIIDPGLKKDENYWIDREGLQKGFFVRNSKTADAIDSASEVFEGPVWPGTCHFPDFFRKDVRDWWGGLYRPLVDIGVAGFWNDMNEPALFSREAGMPTFPPSVVHAVELDVDRGEILPTARRYLSHDAVHNAYGTLMAAATWQGVASLRPNERPFVLSRAGYAGAQRWGAWMWTGDNTSDWTHLQLSLTMSLSVAVCGQPGVGVDIGGFAKAPTPELFGRWMQLGVFLPLCRTHTATGTPPQEPWSFGENVEAACRAAIRWRYRLLPYLYTHMVAACRSDAPPLIRPLWFEFPADEECYSDQWENSEFFVGPDLLVAPALQPGLALRDVYLPSGTDWWSVDPNGHRGERYSGGRVVRNVQTPRPDSEYYVQHPDAIPTAMFVRTGRVLPLRATPASYTDASLQIPLELVWFGESPQACHGLLYLDDGKSPNVLETGEFGLYDVDGAGKASLLEGKGVPELLAISMKC